MARTAHKFRPVAPAGGKVEAEIAPLRIAERGPVGFDPVGRLRLDIGRAFGATGQDRWSPLGTSIFLLAVCGTFWILVALALLSGRS